MEEALPNFGLITIGPFFWGVIETDILKGVVEPPHVDVSVETAAAVASGVPFELDTVDEIGVALLLK